MREEDFKDIKSLALKGWYFAYNHLRKEDLKRLVDKYYSDSSLQDALQEIRSGKEYFVLALEVNKILGFCHIGFKEDVGQLFKLYIDSDLIGKGLGKRLLALGENFLKERGISTYFTLVNKHNEIGANFYLRNGFKHIPEKDEDDEFEPKVLMYIEKKLI